MWDSCLLHKKIINSRRHFFKKRIRPKTLLKLLAPFLQDLLRMLRFRIEFYCLFLVGHVTILYGLLATASLNRTNLFLTSKENYSFYSSFFSYLSCILVRVVGASLDQWYEKDNLSLGTLKRRSLKHKLLHCRRVTTLRYGRVMLKLRI